MKLQILCVTEQEYTLDQIKKMSIQRSTHIHWLYILVTPTSLLNYLIPSPVSKSETKNQQSEISLST